MEAWTAKQMATLKILKLVSGECETREKAVLVPVGLNTLPEEHGKWR